MVIRMNTFYEQWLNREEEWGRQLNKKQNISLIKYLIFTPIISIAALFAIGFLAAGSMELAVSNIKYGAMFGAGIDVLLLLFMLPSKPGRRYKKQLLKILNKTFTLQSDREEFASQMMGQYGPDTVKCISWKDKMVVEERVWVTKDYVLRTTGTGNVWLIQLKLSDHIELDAQTYTHTAGNTVRYNTTDYPIIFRSPKDGSKPVGLKQKLFDTDPSLSFSSRENRDKVVEAIQKVGEAAAMQNL